MPAPQKESYPWRIGAATVDITPLEPIVLTGYIRDKPSQGVRNNIHTKAVYLEAQDGHRALIINVDVCGLSQAVVKTACDLVAQTHGISADYIILSATHNHSAPSIETVLTSYHDLSAAETVVVAEYSAWLPQQIARCVDTAIANATACSLASCTGTVGFGVNRRRVTSQSRHLPTVVDQDVPVLLARDSKGSLKAVIFSYACHTTVMFDNYIDGDYSGYAQHELERHFIGSTAVYLAGCGGDINPVPRRRVELSRIYGHLLATAVIDAITLSPHPLAESSLLAAHATIALALEAPPPEGTIRASMDESVLRQKIWEIQFTPLPAEMSADQITELFELTVKAERRKLDLLLAQYRRPDGPIRTLDYPIQILRIGGILQIIALAGEPVADYSLRLKEKYGFETTWPLGYCNTYLPYIPSRRVLLEGGYEGRTSMTEVGLTAFDESVEQTILARVDQLIESL